MLNLSVEVRVRTGIRRVLPGCGIAVLVLALGSGTLAAQAPQPPTPPPAALPVATPESQDSIQNMPAYGTQTPTKIPELPTATQAPQPVVLPEKATPQVPYTAYPLYGSPAIVSAHDFNGSTYISLDSWVYPALLKLYSMGYLDTMYLNMRPYTRRSTLHMLQASEDAILSSNDAEAQDLLAGLLDDLSDEGITDTTERGTLYGVESVYTRFLGITGPTLRDSFHLGQTFVNDYGRPYQTGFNNSTGFSTRNESGPFSLYLRGEYQHSPSGAGYSQALSAQLSTRDNIPFSGYNLHQATIPTGPIVAQNPFRLMEATLSVHLLGHEISGGKSDAWLGPGLGGAMAWSNNAENIYSFRINRVEPLRIKYLSKVLGPVRYDFFYGSLKGHSYSNDPYVHSEMFSFQPTRDFQFGFQRTVVFGGEGHEPVTLHTFLKGFFDTNDTNSATKFSRDDPGARFSSFTFSYRLPFVRKYLTLYADSETHDDLTPVSAPRRAAYRPGIFLSQFPGIPKLDLRVEGVSTDCSTLVCQSGNNEYTETIQKQAYTNKGFILGDWIGREAKGGQAWLTYHLSPREQIGIEYLNKKTPKDFIDGGTTQNQFKVYVVKRLRNDIEINGWFQHEGWKAPTYLPGMQNDNTIAVQVTFFQKLKTLAR